MGESYVGPTKSHGSHSLFGGTHMILLNNEERGMKIPHMGLRIV